MASIQKYQDRVNRKIYSYLCTDHGYAEVVSTLKYPVVCVHHKPIYLFEDPKNTHFLSFHWVSTFLFFKKNTVFSKMKSSHFKLFFSTHRNKKNIPPK